MSGMIIARRMLAAAAAAGAALVWTHLPVRAEEPPSPPERPPRIAVVNVSEVFDAYKRTQDQNKKMKVLFESRKEALDKRGEEIKKREIQLKNDTRARSDIGYMADAQKLSLDLARFKQDYEAFLKEYEEFNFKNTQLILAEILEAVRRYSEKNGYDLVMQVGRLKVEGGSTAQLTSSFRDKAALYYSKSADITPAIIKVLDSAYEQGISLVKPEALEGGEKNEKK